eukprot:comp12250_c0_seq1/m.7044 comp12250_c0_seq1/g.7044  ORF comp12250_c0_seq1/g.7044 comp12250_c0_seq1/m.7044 type:complete len:479 (-) comp12250_c0_seq1:94-1530(-)
MAEVKGGAPGEPIFVDLSADATSEAPTTLPAYCVNCEETGISRIFLTRIPYFREVVIMAFECEHCGFRSSEIIPGGAIQPKGVSVSLKITEKEDNNRQFVKTDKCTVRIPELDFEIPPGKGQLTTIEGVMEEAVSGLEADQTVRRIMEPETAQKIDDFLGRLRKLLTGEELDYHFVLDDPTGNSFLENPHAPHPDPNMKITKYERTKEQIEKLGLTASEEGKEKLAAVQEAKQKAIEDFRLGVKGQVHKADKVVPTREEGDNVEEKTVDVGKDEVMKLESLCPSCLSPVDLKMHVLDIPYFKDVVIMALACDECGERSSEVKVGGGIAEHGRKITLKVTSPDDLSRDVLKSDTATLSIPEIGLENAEGVDGCKFTTLEGILTTIKERLTVDNPFFSGDSAPNEHGVGMKKFIYDLDEAIAGRLPFTFIMDDPTSNSYLQNLYAPDPDPEMTIEDYERTHEQNEMLGLNDMKVENYEEK